MDTLIGMGVLAAAITLLTLLTVWSRRRIDRIAGSGLASAREIEKGDRDE
ncbi:hypothetical protein [Kiritimatiella glycovorans]|uniref:Uncharacterized protein n=1 Tax=Kiritimatiella glycovorans TaxID=1307763 RepID=A0A0G3EGT8_9BACT|nr:hypothetical protein [Kiritimatiella glycovorans]AKJ64025.1 hypothetical protein L21SP4_00757 [Kiritimatiella glycovorans]